MNKRNSLLTLSMFLLVSGLLFSQAGRSPSGGGRSSERLSQAGGRADINPVLEAEISKRSNSISVAGRLQPRSRIVHKASVAGYVGAVFVNEGDNVQEEDPLFRIDRNGIGQTFKPVYINSRISGVVSKIDIQIYSEISVGNPGVTLIATDSYLVKAVISDKDAFRITVGQTVTGRNPEGLGISGILTGRSQEPDYNTGLFRLDFEFPEKEGFYIGSFILIQLPTDEISGIFVKRDLLVRRYGSYYLWVIDEDNKLTAREVEAGAFFGEDVYIDSGIEPGERYLSELTGKETEGMEVGRGNK